ncbi:MAG TPA: galactose-1-phosphate uridylyltransferase [Candidatus Nanoarchaeia archaeon]|nr:galactose-1-phosphate uridylyltransferase [Candidatus Nanoarchaeia archaeon]
MELRKDYLLNNWVLIAEDRGKRPSDFGREKEIRKAFCVFCPGSESQTPPELDLIKDNSGNWKARVIPNKFAAVNQNGESGVQTHNNYYTFSGAFGEHEVVIETPEHDKTLGSLPEEHIADLFKLYARRVKSMLSNPKAKYVSLFKNQGKAAGASIQHAHSQLISTSIVPPLIYDKVKVVRSLPYCPYCDIIQREKNSDRRCFENDSFVAFTPYASQFNYEVWVFPKDHIKDFSDFSDKKYSDLANIVKKILTKLDLDEIPYDMSWTLSPTGENLHMHIEIMPRLAIWAGMEMGFGVKVNAVSPESAARYYRGEK